jgi:hypothetical protein
VANAAAPVAAVIQLAERDAAGAGERRQQARQHEPVRRPRPVHVEQAQAGRPERAGFAGREPRQRLLQALQLAEERRRARGLRLVHGQARGVAIDLAARRQDHVAHAARSRQRQRAGRARGHLEQGLDRVVAAERGAGGERQVDQRVGRLREALDGARVRDVPAGMPQPADRPARGLERRPQRAADEAVRPGDHGDSRPIHARSRPTRSRQ